MSGPIVVGNPGRSGLERRPSSPRPGLDRRRLLALLAAIPATGAVLTGCGVLGGGGAGGGGAGGEDLRSEIPPLEPGPVEDAHGALVPFAATFLPAALAEAGTPNVVCSPASALIALTMTGLGAAGQTRAQMEQVLGGPMADLAEVSNILRTSMLAIPSRAEEDLENPDMPEPDSAALVNAVWFREGMEVQEPYLDDLSRYFDAGVRTADFVEEGPREEARTAMNGLVEEVTDGMIKDLVPAQALRANTVIVLINALHLKGAWQAPLTETTAPFQAEGGAMDVPMLQGEAAGWHEDAHGQATLLPTFDEDLGLVLVRPVQGLASLLEAWQADPSLLAALLSGFASSEDVVDLTMPALDLASDLSLADALAELGMPDAFSGAADFSGISATTGISLSHVLQKATLVVDAEGMEAAAVTAVIGVESAAPAAAHALVLDVPHVAIAISTATLAPLVVAVVRDPGA